MIQSNHTVADRKIDESGTMATIMMTLIRFANRRPLPLEKKLSTKVQQGMRFSSYKILFVAFASAKSRIFPYYDWRKSALISLEKILRFLKNLNSSLPIIIKNDV